MIHRRIHACLPLLILMTAALACSFPTGQAAPTPDLPLATETALPPTLPPGGPVETAQVPTGTPAQGISEVVIYFIALEDQGQSGIPVGCGDSLVEVRQPMDPTTTPVEAALARLFSFKTQYIGESGLYHALYQSNLSVDSVEVGPAGDVSVALSGSYALGGVCDNPRFQGQIEQTVKTASGASAVNVTINGVPLRDIVSGQ